MMLALAVFMTRKNFIDTFDKADDYFTGYFTDKKLTDIDDKYVASIVTYEDLIKVSNQMKRFNGRDDVYTEVFWDYNVRASYVSVI